MDVLLQGNRGKKLNGVPTLSRDTETKAEQDPLEVVECPSMRGPWKHPEDDGIKLDVFYTWNGGNLCWA